MTLDELIQGLTELRENVDGEAKVRIAHCNTEHGRPEVTTLQEIVFALNNGEGMVILGDSYFTKTVDSIE